MKEDEALIKQLCDRFEKKPRKCKKINDSNIGSAERIVCIDKDTFYYYPKIQQFQDLDFDKLQYIVPKAGVILSQILQLKFPPRRQNQRNFFSITLPKNKILKFTKSIQPKVVDEYAEGQQVWTFYFDYDIVALPTRQKKIKEARLKEIQNEKIKQTQFVKLKEKLQKDKIQKINEEINSLNQAEQLRSGGGQNEEYLLKKQLLNEKQEAQKRLEESDELFFHYNYRKLLTATSQKAVLQNQLILLEKLGKFKLRAEETVRQFIDQLPFSPIKIKNGQYYEKNNLRLKFGDKNINLQYLGNSQVANALYILKDEFKEWQLRVPLKALIKYKGFKVLACAKTPLQNLKEQQFDDAIIHGHSSDNWKIHFLLIQVLTEILNILKLKPFFSQVHYQKVLIHLGSNLKIVQTSSDPFAYIKKLEPLKFDEPNNYKIRYLYDIDEIFPIDLDLNDNINQQNVRLRPQYIRRFVYNNHPKITHLSAGSLTYSFEDQQGQKQDILVAKASQVLKLQQIVLFVKRLDNLDVIVKDSDDLSKIMKQNGINMRYLGKIVKITQLPYIRVMAQIDAISRVIRNLYRDHQRQFSAQIFRKKQDIATYINQAFNPKLKLSMKKIRIKQLKQEEQKYTKIDAVDFLNMIFGMCVDFEPFWAIVRKIVQKRYEIDMKQPQDYPHGYLLKTVLHQCDIKIKLNDKLKLFQTPQPFSINDDIQFITKTKIYDFPSMQIFQIASITNINADQLQKILPRLQLQLKIKRALNESESQVLLKLSRLTSKIGPPSQKYTLESFFYYLYHPNVDNFQLIYKIAQTIFPSSHPYIMELYLEYSKIKELDVVTLKKAASIHSIRNLGISHWKTSQILSNFKQNEYINNLIKAQAGVLPSQKTDLYLSIVKQLSKYGKLLESLSYVNRCIAIFNNVNNLKFNEQENYFAILLQGIQNYYVSRNIQQSLVLSQTLYYTLVKYNVQPDSKWFYSMLFYTLKGFLEYSPRKYYLYKLILILQERQTSEVTQHDKSLIFQQFSIKWKQSRNHINHIKQMLIKLEFGFTQMNYLPDFFVRFDFHKSRLNNQDFHEGLKELNEFYKIFGFNYFEQALLDNVFAFEKIKSQQKQQNQQQFL